MGMHYKGEGGHRMTKDPTPKEKLDICIEQIFSPERAPDYSFGGPAPVLWGKTGSSTGGTWRFPIRPFTETPIGWPTAKSAWHVYEERERVAREQTERHDEFRSEIDRDIVRRAMERAAQKSILDKQKEIYDLTKTHGRRVADQKRRELDGMTQLCDAMNIPYEIILEGDMTNMTIPLRMMNMTIPLRGMSYAFDSLGSSIRGLSGPSTADIERARERRAIREEVAMQMLDDLRARSAKIQDEWEEHAKTFDRYALSPIIDPVIREKHQLAAARARDVFAEVGKVMQRLGITRKPS
jgi:hypothetical protein